VGEEVALRQRLSRQLEMAKQGHERALAAVRLASTKSIGLYEVAHAEQLAEEQQRGAQALAAAAAEHDAAAAAAAAEHDAAAAAAAAEHDAAAAAAEHDAAAAAAEHDAAAAAAAAEHAATAAAATAAAAEHAAAAAAAAAEHAAAAAAADQQYAWRIEELARAVRQREAQMVVGHAAAIRRMRAESERAQAVAEQARQAELEAEAALRDAEHDALPPMIKKLLTASKLGRFEEHSNCVAILDDIATCLVSGSTRGRQLSPESKQLYGLLLNNGSAWAHKFVAANLFGPSLRHTQKTRAAYEGGMVSLGLTRTHLKNLKEVYLPEYSLQDVPGIISEDGTAAWRRLDFDELHECTAAGAWDSGIGVWGFADDVKVVHSVEELRALFEKKLPIASTVYVYTWVPILKNAPWFPFAIIASDNKFDNAWVFNKWRLMHIVCGELGLPLAGHMSDGDARLRKCDYRINFATNSQEDPMHWCQKVYFLKHSLLMLSVPTTVEGLSIFGGQDYMHIGWR
jgi:hypothetical protein